MLVLVLLWGCSENNEVRTKNNHTEKEINKPLPENDFENPIPTNDKTQHYRRDSIIKLAIKKFENKTIYNAPFYWTSNNNVYFFHSAGKLDPDNTRSLKDRVIQFGISDSSGKELLPCIYKKITSPDLLVKNWVEIKKNGLYGLFNYQNGKLIEVKYHYILKSENKIIAKTDSGFVSILLSDGTTSPIAFDLIEHLKNWQFDYFKTNRTPLVNANEDYVPNDANYGSGTLISGSFESIFCNPNDFRSGLINGNEDMGIIKYSGKFERIEKEKSFLTSFFEQGIDGRGWETESYFLNTMDSSGNIADQKLVLEDFGYLDFEYCHELDQKIEFINDSIFLTTQPEFSDKNFKYYDSYSGINLFKVTPSGEIKELTANRNFSFTKHIIVTKELLHGCYVRYDNENHKLNLPETECLDIMRNEIFAEYGYIFKSEKWSNYFRKIEWYKPEHNNVDSLLNDIEKENVRILLDLKKEVNN